MITTSNIIGYSPGMPLLVFNPEQGVYYWEIVIGCYCDNLNRRKVVTKRYWRGQPLVDKFGGFDEYVTPTYLQTSLDYLKAKEEWIYFAQKDEVPPIVYYLN